jgi:hypothetical protein
MGFEQTVLSVFDVTQSALGVAEEGLQSAEGFVLPTPTIYP